MYKHRFSLVMLLFIEACMKNFTIKEAAVEHAIGETLKHAPNKPGGTNFVRKR
jgi:hypothetical protein